MKNPSFLGTFTPFFFVLQSQVPMMIMFNENYDCDNDKSNIDENYDGNDIQIL